MCKGLGSDLPPVIGPHFNNKKPAVVDATLIPDMPITLFRFWRMDGKYFFTSIEGITEEPKRHLLGTNGTGRFDDVSIPHYLQQMVHQGFPHHPVIVHGLWKEHLKAIAQNLGMICVG